MLSQDYVVWSYRILLGREPENENASNVQFETEKELVEFFIGSDEFRHRHPTVLNHRRSGRAIVPLDAFGVDGRLTVDIGDGIGRQVLEGTYEPQETAFFRRHVRKGCVVLDVGANIGLFTIMASCLVGETGRVYAFEALPENIAMIRSSLAENRLSSNVTLYHALVADRERDDLEIAFHPLEEQDTRSPLAHLGGSFVVGRDQILPPYLRRKPIRTLPLDEMVPASDRVDFIKIDIEGAEMLAMRGASRILDRDRPMIMTEVHPAQLRSVSSASWGDYRDFMASKQYRPVEILDGAISHPAVIEDESTVYNIAFVPESTA